MSQSNIGKEISREEALEIAEQISVDADKRRLDFAKEEAQREAALDDITDDGVLKLTFEQFAKLYHRIHELSDVYDLRAEEDAFPDAKELALYKFVLDSRYSAIHCNECTHWNDDKDICKLHIKGMCESIRYTKAVVRDETHKGF